MAKSFHRLSMATPVIRLSSLIGAFSSSVNKIVLDFMGFDGTDFGVPMHNELMFGATMYAVCTASYVDMRRRGLDVSALRYEDLVARPLDMCRVVLEFCHMPVSLAELAVKAFEVDSHRNSVLSESAIGHVKAPELTPETKQQLNELMKKFGLPLLDEPRILEGSLSC